MCINISLHQKFQGPSPSFLGCFVNLFTRNQNLSTKMSQPPLAKPTMFSHDVYQYKLTQKVSEPKSSIFRLLWDLKSTKGIIKGKCWKKFILIFGLFLLVIMIKIINIWNGGIKLVNLIPILLYFVTFYDRHKCKKNDIYDILWHLWPS